MVPVKYNLRNLFVRKSTTIMTLGSIAFVVLVYIGVLALAGGLAAAFNSSGDPSTVVVLRDGARSEMESGYSADTFRILESLPGIVRGDGDALASGETIHLQILKRADGTEANIMLRGVEGAAFVFRPQLEIVEGRRFEAGKNEVIVGKPLARRYANLALGSTIQLGRLPFRVVGVFDSGGASDSEIWGNVNDFGETFRRTNYVSSTRLKAASPSAAKDLIATLGADPRLRVEAMPEPEYYERQAVASSAQFVLLGNALAVMMAFGACFSAANTMYAQVASRGREIGTLRALGFPRRSIMAGFVIEAVLLGLLAGGFGALLSLPLNAVTTGTMNSLTFSEVTFQLRTTPSAIFAGVFLATVTGVIGGLLPAFSASRQRITDLLREA